MKSVRVEQIPAPIDEIKKVVFIGAGTMGCFNALLTGMSGYEAILFDISDQMLQWTGFRLEKIGEFLVGKNLFTATQVAEGRKHIDVEADPARAIKNADLLSESVPERLELKRSVHQEFDGLCPSCTIMTTNTSNLLVSQIQEPVHRGDRFAAMHFHYGSPLVDLVQGPRTSKQTMDILYRFVKSLNCIPHIHKKENAGYVYNAIMTGRSQASWALVLDHYERIEDLDRAWMIFQKEKIGPFGIMDFLGINVYFDGITGHLMNSKRTQLAQRSLDYLQSYIDRNQLGIKTGKGFYAYPDPLYQKPEFLKLDPKDELRYEAMENGLILQAVLLVIDDIASVEEVDRLWMLVTSSEKGPFAWLHKKGVQNFLSQIKIPFYKGVYPLDRLDDIVSYLTQKPV